MHGRYRLPSRRRVRRRGGSGGCERQHQLDREDDAADRSVKRGGDAAAGAGGNQQGPLPDGHGDHLPESRAEGGTDLDDRSLAAPEARRQRLLFLGR